MNKQRTIGKTAKKIGALIVGLALILILTHPVYAQSDNDEQTGNESSSVETIDSSVSQSELVELEEEVLNENMQQEEVSGTPPNYGVMASEAEMNSTITNGDALWNATFYSPVKYQSTDDGEGSFYVDFLGEVSMEYTGTKTGDYMLTIYDMSYDLLTDENGNYYANQLLLSNGAIFDYSIIDATEFMAVYQRHVVGHHYLPDTWRIVFNNETVTVQTSVNKPINPTEIKNTADHPDATIRWEIKDTDGNVVLSGDSLIIAEDLLENLPDGSYSISTIAESATKYGNPISASDSDTFVIRRPQASVVIDAPIDPESVTVGQKLPDSTLTWTLKDSDGNILETGSGTDVPIPAEPGVYTVEAKEVSTEGLVSVAIDTFEILPGAPVVEEEDLEEADQAANK